MAATQGTPGAVPCVCGRSCSAVTAGRTHHATPTTTNPMHAHGLPQ
jgi:hypothetical protein